MTTDKRKTAILYGDTEELLVDFTDEEVGQVFRALLAYINRGEEIETKDRAIRNLYKTIKAGIDRNLQAYEEKCEKNKQIALKREQLRRERRVSLLSRRMTRISWRKPLPMLENMLKTFS